MSNSPSTIDHLISDLKVSGLCRVFLRGWSVNIHTICAWKYDWRCCAQFIAKSFMKLLYDQTPPKRAAKTTCSSCPSTNSISPLKRVLLVLGAQPLQGYWPLLSDLLAQLYVLVGMSSERGKKGQRPHNLVPTDDKN
jgi:hypothetical protein